MSARMVSVRCSAGDQRHLEALLREREQLQGDLLEAETDPEERKSPEEIQASRLQLASISSILAPRGSVYHSDPRCYVVTDPNQAGHGRFIRVPLADLPPGMRLCRAPGGCSG
jgi:hypothetical protein